MEPSQADFASLFIDNKQFEKLENSLSRFCPFEAVGMVRQEVRHGHFLSYILDPMRPHGMGTHCLRAFFLAAANYRDNALSAPNILSPLHVHLMEFEDVRVMREWQDIDIVIEVPNQNLIVAIEIKIDAKEHGDQLTRYRKTVNKNWPNHVTQFIFLTKAGDEPSETHGAGWQTMPLEALVSSFERVLTKLPQAPGLATFSAYIRMLKRNHLGDDELEEVARELWAKHREVLEYLSDRRPNALADAFTSIIQDPIKLTDQISNETGLQIILDSVSGSSTIRLAAIEWDDVPKMLSGSWTLSRRLILAEIKAWRGESVAIYLQLGKGEANDRRVLYDKLCQSGVVKDPDRFGPDWKRLSSKTIISAKNIEDKTVEEITKLVVEKATPELVAQFKRFDRAMRGIEAD